MRLIRHDMNNQLQIVSELMKTGENRPGARPLMGEFPERMNKAAKQ